MVDKTRLTQFISSQELGAGTLWTVLPSAPNLRLSCEHIRIALCLRLCIDTATVPATCKRCPLCKADISGSPKSGELPGDYHIQVCGRDGELSKRHNAVQTAIRLEATKRGQPSSLHKTVLATSPALILDLFFKNISGKSGASGTVVDVSICHHANIPAGPIDTPLASSAAREKVKVSKYKTACDALGLEFMPIVFESTGALGQSAKDFFATLLVNSPNTVEDLDPADDFVAMVRSIVMALHRSTGDKFIAAAQFFRGETLRHQLDQGQPLPRPRWGAALSRLDPLDE